MGHFQNGRPVHADGRVQENPGLARLAVAAKHPFQTLVQHAFDDLWRQLDFLVGQQSFGVINFRQFDFCTLTAAFHIRRIEDFGLFKERLHRIASSGLKLRKKTVCRVPFSLAPSGIRTNCERVHVAGSAPSETAKRKNLSTFSSG